MAIEQVLGKATAVSSTVDLYLDNDGIAWIVLNNKEKPVNVIGETFVKDMHAILLQVSKLYNEKKVKVVVFYSTKTTFLAGADITGLYQVTSLDLALQASKAGQDLFNLIANLPVPTIAAMNGSALGGGLELALACTYRVSNTDKKTQLGLPEIKLGVLPGAGGTVRLPRVIGLQEALKIILAGASVNPSKAKKLGLVDATFEHVDKMPNENKFFNQVKQFALKSSAKPKQVKKYASQSWAEYALNDNCIGRKFVASTARNGLDKQTKGKYPAPYAALESILYSYGASIQSALDFEANSFAHLCVTPESKSLMTIFFLMENSKKLEGRFTSKPSDVKRTAVIGAGVMGSGIAQLFAHKDIAVYMKDINDEFVKKGLTIVANMFDELAKKKKLLDDEANRKKNLVKGGTDYSQLADTEVIVEAAVERMDLKKKILQECEAKTNENAIFATNTSTLSVNELATASKRPQNVVGMHFFNPVSRMPLVEIIRGKETSEKTIATIYKLALKLGKVPICVNDGPGFLVNRILGIYTLEAARLLKEGCDIEHIDQVIMDFGMPMGPFRLLDEVGIDVAAHSSNTLAALGARFNKTEIGQVMNKLVENNYLGKKSGKGFYTYKDGKSAGLEPSLPQLIPGFDPKNAKKLPAKTIVDRCILLMVNEAAYILEEKIADKPEDVDIGMIFGTGFAPFRGGLLQYADTEGINNIVQRLQKLTQQFGDRFKPAPMLLTMAKNNGKFFPERPQITKALKSKL